MPTLLATQEYTPTNDGWTGLGWFDVDDNPVPDHYIMINAVDIDKFGNVLIAEFKDKNYI